MSILLQPFAPAAVINPFKSPCILGDIMNSTGITEIVVIYVSLVVFLPFLADLGVTVWSLITAIFVTIVTYDVKLTVDVNAFGSEPVLQFATFHPG